MSVGNKYLEPRIQELFDVLENDMFLLNYEHAEITIARLSKYFHLFDDELTDYYQWAQEAIEGTYEYQEDDSLFDWDGDALASAGFGTDEDYL